MKKENLPEFCFRTSEKWSSSWRGGKSRHDGVDGKRPWLEGILSKPRQIGPEYQLEASVSDSELTKSCTVQVEGWTQSCEQVSSMVGTSRKSHLLCFYFPRHMKNHIISLKWEVRQLMSIGSQKGERVRQESVPSPAWAALEAGAQLVPQVQKFIFSAWSEQGRAD